MSRRVGVGFAEPTMSLAASGGFRKAYTHPTLREFSCPNCADYF